MCPMELPEAAIYDINSRISYTLSHVKELSCRMIEIIINDASLGDFFYMNIL